MSATDVGKDVFILTVITVQVKRFFPVEMDARSATEGKAVENLGTGISLGGRSMWGCGLIQECPCNQSVSGVEFIFLHSVRCHKN